MDIRMTREWWGGAIPGPPIATGRAGSPPLAPGQCADPSAWSGLPACGTTAGHSQQNNPMWHTTAMNTQAALALVAGVTALIVAATHLVTDLNGTLDKLRKTPRGAAAAPPAAPQQPSGPPAS